MEQASAAALSQETAALSQDDPAAASPRSQPAAPQPAAVAALLFLLFPVAFGLADLAPPFHLAVVRAPALLIKRDRSPQMLEAALAL